KESPLAFPTPNPQDEGIQAISTSEFNMNSTSEGQAHQVLVEKLYGSIEESIRLKNKVEENYKQELVNTTRKAQSGGSSGGGGKRGKAGTGGSADVTRRPRQSSAASDPHFWVPICVSLPL
ncbi:hypothetical protein CR513_26381, partial [Mucuna pruriens]